MFDRVKNEQGAVLVVALLMLVILSIMGGFALTISMLETQVTKNSEMFQHNFYTLEAVTLEGTTKIHDEPDANLLSPAYSWMKDDTLPIDLTQSAQWPSALLTPQATTLTAAPADITPNGYAPDGTTAGDRIWYAAIDHGICHASTGSGGSLTGSSSFEEHCYDVYGMYDVKRGNGKTYVGRMMMQVGYKKALYP